MAIESVGHDADTVLPLRDDLLFMRTRPFGMDGAILYLTPEGQHKLETDGAFEDLLQRGTQLVAGGHYTNTQAVKDQGRAELLGDSTYSYGPSSAVLYRGTEAPDVLVKGSRPRQRNGMQEFMTQFALQHTLAERSNGLVTMGTPYAIAMSQKTGATALFRQFFKGNDLISQTAWNRNRFPNPDDARAAFEHGLTTVRRALGWQALTAPNETRKSKLNAKIMATEHPSDNPNSTEPAMTYSVHSLRLRLPRPRIVHQELADAAGVKIPLQRKPS